MRKTIAALICSVLAASGLFGQGASGRPMTVDDALNMVRVADVLMSPDGRRVFFSKSELDWGENKRKKKYYMIAADGGEATQFIGEAGGRSFQFSPDGQHLSFLRSVDGNNQIFRLSTSGGEAVRLTNHKNGIVSYKWAPDGSTIFFTAAEALDDERQKEYDLGADSYRVREGSNGREGGRWRNLWVFPLSSKEEARLTDEELVVGNFDVSPDGRRVVFSAVKQSLSNYFFLSELYVVETENGQVTRLTNNNAGERNAVWAPDGKSIAYHAASDKDEDLTHGFFWIINPETGEKRKLQGPHEGRGLTWTSDSKSLLFNETRRTDSNLCRLDVATGQVTALTSVSGTLRALGFSKDRTRMVYSFSDFGTPPDLYGSALDQRDPVRLSDANPWIASEILLAEAEIVRWKSKDGMEIEGVFYRPGQDRVGRLPLLLHIHGGPPGHFGNEFRPNFHIFSGLGYGSFGPNIRGSDSYGDDLLTALAGDVGGGEYDDVMTGVDYLIEQRGVDPDRMGLRGWSWGGILGSWVITRTDRFKAASLGAMVGSWTAETGPGLSYDLRIHYIEGEHWTHPREWRRVSSLWYVKSVTTPTLLLHGDRDLVSTLNQSLMFFTALKDIGKAPVRLVRFPREGHGFDEPRHQRSRDIEEILWMQKYVMGVDWTPWQRPEGAKKAH